jgi:hypothetical protein
MRIVGLALTGMLAVSAATPAHTDPLGSKMEPARRAPGVIQVWDGGGSGRHHVPDGTGGGGHPAPGHTREWKRGWVPPHWGPNRYFGGWGPPGAWGGPYSIWGGPYVPYGSYGDWGALWYPYAEWRGPTGGWGNP